MKPNRIPALIALIALVTLFALASCSGPSTKGGESNNGANNGGSNNGANNGGSNNGASNNGGSNNGATNNANNGANNGQTIPNNDQCACVWEGPVEYTVNNASRTAEGVYLVGDLSWQPCCQPGSSETRTWFVDWEGVSKIATAVPTGAEPITVPDPEAEEFVVSSETAELVFVLTASDSVDSETLEVGIAYAVEGETRTETGPIEVDVKR